MLPVAPTNPIPTHFAATQAPNLLPPVYPNFKIKNLAITPLASPQTSKEPGGSGVATCRPSNLSAVEIVLVGVTSPVSVSGPSATIVHPRRRQVVRRDAGRLFSDATVESDSLADVVERMFAAFESELSLETIVGVVRRARRELDVVAGPSLTEMLERLARQRLTNLAELQAPAPAAVG